MTQSSNERGYTRRWRKARRRFIQENPLCVECLKQGLVVPATVVHHTVQHHGDPVIFWDESKWQSLCKEHHDRDAQAAEKRGYRTQVDEDGWPVDQNHPANAGTQGC